ncbi:MAG: hypothetical protein LAP85_09785 [Acidobacteriia bacterium]|nr:hypothetical protein [Terriglobia bacterium]
MRRTMASWMGGIGLGTLLAAGIELAPAGDLFDVDVRQLAGIWETEHVSPANPYALRHAELKQRLETLSSSFPDLVHTAPAGKSVEGREIFLVTVGSGTERILIWSQMHGDEPTATCALIDILQYFGAHRKEPWISVILEKYTLLIIPMLNPDGAARMQRRNAQGIDINRDARALQTPEGRLLKEIRARYQPFLGFNLHNQNAATTVGDTGRVATIALLAVAADAPGASGSVPLAKEVTAVVYEALSPFIYGHISRYDEGFNPRAFGDNLTLWGTPVVLIESGGNPADEPLNFGVKLNFVALSAVLNSLASGRIGNANPAVFDALKLNSDNPIYDTMLHNARIFTGTGVPVFRGDVAIRADTRAGGRGQAVVAELGDLGVYTAHQTIDCTNYLVTPGLIAWNPDSSLFAGDQTHSGYLERGILTVLETARWPDLAGRHPAPREWSARARQVNWGYLVSGNPLKSAAPDQVLLAEWLSAGGRAFVPESGADASGTEGIAAVPRWFGLPALAHQEALRYRVPAGLEGDVAEVLPRYTSEAASKFGLGRRGVIAQGNPADLVIWGCPADRSSFDLRDCKPRYVLMDGHVIDLARPDRPSYGRFLGK